MTTAIAAAVVLGGGLVFERFAVPRLRPRFYLRLGFPLGAGLVPLTYAPQGEGNTATVTYEATEDAVFFWADMGSRRGPFGLHGTIRLTRCADGRIAMDVVWCPPWVAMLASVWLAVLGLWRGEAHIGGLVAAVLLVAVVVVYRQAALRAVAEIRWALTSQQED